jgi:hypothetical protein
MACGSRLSTQHEWLRTAIAEYIEEELGHEEWILSDIAACDGDAEKVRHSRPHISTEMMVAYAYHQIDRGNPVGFFGMVHVLEGTSIAIATNAAGSIKESLDLPPNAFSYLNSHGSLDLEHVKFFDQVSNRLATQVMWKLDVRIRRVRDKHLRSLNLKADDHDGQVHRNKPNRVID